MISAPNLIWQNKIINYPSRYYSVITPNEVYTCNNVELLGLYTQSTNGYIREIAILKLMKDDPNSSIPYLVQLLSEYVIEIIISIADNITKTQQELIIQYLNANPEYYDRIKDRISSYWDCYHRWQYPKLKYYPPNQIINLK